MLGEYETWRTVLIEERSKTGTVVGNEKANVRFYEEGRERIPEFLSELRGYRGEDHSIFRTT